MIHYHFIQLNFILLMSILFNQNNVFHYMNILILVLIFLMLQIMLILLLIQVLIILKYHKNLYH